MVSQLLYDLPASERYRVIFMERDAEEMLISQEKMLQRLNRSAAPRDEMKRYFSLHLERLHAWLRQQQNFLVLRMNYNELVELPAEQALRVREFLGAELDSRRMAEVVEPSLYRNRQDGLSSIGHSPLTNGQ